MKFFSTRDSNNKAGFKKAVLDCMPSDGGLYVPEDSVDLRRWILYADENTSFSSLAGALTSAMINDEFSPIICETIVTRAFKNNPEFRQLDENLFLLELYNGATGTFKDYGVSYLTATLETILQLDGEKAILLDATTGELGACMAKAMKDKKLLKSVLLCPKGSLRGMDESDFVWNGGNLFPVEVDGTIEDCRNLVRRIFASRELVEKGRISFHEGFDRWQDAIAAACEPLLKDGTIEQIYVDEIIKKVTELGPYIVIAPNIAIPHAQEGYGVHDTAVCFMRTERPVSFSDDGEYDARLFFVLASVNNDEHLKNLVEMSDALSDEDYVEKLLACKTAEDLLKLEGV